MHSGAVISGGFFWGIFQIRIQASKCQNGIKTFFWKKTLADQNVKMAAIFQDGRHFEYQNIRFRIKHQIIVIIE